MEAVDTNNNGNKEIIYLSNREDGRNRNSSWKDVNYIFDVTNNSLTSFGSSHFSHDLMIHDFDNDQHVEVLDYYYGDNAIVKQNVRNKNAANKYRQSFISSKRCNLFGGYLNLGNTTFAGQK